MYLEVKPGFETGKISGSQPGFEKAVMKLEQYQIWLNLDFFQVWNKPGFENPQFQVHFKPVPVTNVFGMKISKVTQMLKDLVANFW